MRPLNVKLFILFFTMLLVKSNVTYAENSREFAGINFGIGISLTHDIGNNGRVSGAILDENGIVRVTKQENDVARIMLESHYFFTPEKNDIPFFGLAKGIDWGHGPFIALQPGTDEIIEAIGIGWMVGFRREPNSPNSWNIGVGYVVDPNTQVLADGVIENSALPDGETQIRYKETSQRGIFLLASFNF